MIYEKINNEFTFYSNNDDYIECSICQNLFPISETILCDLCNFFYCLNDYNSHFNIYHSEENVDQNFDFENNNLELEKIYFNQFENKIKTNLNKILTNKNIEKKNEIDYDFIKKDLELYLKTKKEYLILNSNNNLLNLCETCGFECFLSLKYERFQDFSYFNLFLIKQCKFKHIQEINLNQEFHLEKIKCQKCKKNNIDKYFYFISSKEIFCKNCSKKDDLLSYNLKKFNYLDLSETKEKYKQRLELIKNKKIDEVSKFLDNFINTFKKQIEKNLINQDSLLDKEIKLFEIKNKNLIKISKLLIDKFEYDLNNNCLTNETNESFKNIFNFNPFTNFSKFSKENFLDKNNLIENLISENNLILKMSKNNENNNNKEKKYLNYSNANFLFVKPLKNGNFIISFNLFDDIFIEIFKYPNYMESHKRLINVDSKSPGDYIINIFELSNNNLILQTKKRNLYFLEEKQLLLNNNVSHKYFENLFWVFPKKENIYYVLEKKNDFNYYLYEFEKFDLKSKKIFYSSFNIVNAFYFKIFEFIFFHGKEKIGNYNINKNISNVKKENFEYDNFIKLKNQIFLLDNNLIKCFDVRTLQKISIFSISNRYISLKLLNYNSLIALDKKNYIIHLDSIFSMKEIKKIKFKKYDFFILKNGILFLNENNIEINFDLID
jgi:hypothetical protein